MVNDKKARTHVIVTGGSSGIGAAVVEELRDRGTDVTVFDLEPPTRADVGFERVDVVDEPGVVRAVAAAEARFGIATGAVTCHGIRGEFVPTLDLDLDHSRRVFDIHVMGTLSVCREIVRRLDGRAASLVLVSSTTAYGGWINQSDYGPAKVAVRQLSANFAIEWAPLGVRVNSVAPGHTLTPMVRELVDSGYDLAPLNSRTPLGRLAMPEESAASIIHLLSDATYVTGQCLPVDGGWTAVRK